MTIVRTYVAICYIIFVASLISGATTSALNVVPGADYQYVVDYRYVVWGTTTILALQILLYHLRVLAAHSLYARTHWKWASSYHEKRMFGTGDAPRLWTVMEMTWNVILFVVWGIYCLRDLKSLQANIPLYCVENGTSCILAKLSPGFGYLAFACLPFRMIYLLVVLAVSCVLAKYPADLETRLVNGRLTTRRMPNRMRPMPSATVNMDNVVSNPTGDLLLGRLCKQCHSAQCAQESIFCGADCVSMSKIGAPKLMELTPIHYMYREIKDIFNNTWTLPETKPLLMRIFAIVSTNESDRMHKIYKEGVEIRANSVARTAVPGNQHQMWHGNRRECAVGEPDHEALCRSTSCAMCSAIRSSFGINRLGGPGKLSVYAMASKAHESSRNGVNSRWAALLLNSVVGNSYPTSVGSPELDQPPNGYDSILRQYDTEMDKEMIFFQNNAIRPTFLVLYQLPSGPSE